MTITHLYVDATVADNPLAARFAERLGLAPIIVPDTRQLYDTLKKEADPQAGGKQRLLLTRNQGAFIRQCPGTKEYTCCDYQILHIGTYCTMDCAYCILQSYFHPPVLQYFINQEDLLRELDAALVQGRTLRIGTGEFTDSLIWEAWSDLTPLLVERFARQDRSVLELKTKTTAVGGLLDLDHRRRTIMAWSLNTPRIIATQERGTTSLKARLRAAAQCQERGYPLALHFDPIVLYPGCEEEYRQVIDTLFQYVDPDNIVWISMGTLRFMPALQPVIEQRFPDSAIVHGEFITGIDNKMRYFKPLRIDIYRRIAGWIRAHAPNATVYLCMEDETVWQSSLGFSPETQGGLPAMLDQSARRVCGVT